MASYKSFSKEPYEEFSITMDMSPKMKSGATIASMEAGYPKATKISDGTDATSTVLGSATISGTIITQPVKGGTDGERYKIEWRVIDSNNEKHEEGLIMEVSNL